MLSPDNDHPFRVAALFASHSPESQGIELSGRIQILDSGDLLISNVRESDAGLYTCIRANEAGIVTEEAYLGVMGKFGFCVCYPYKFLKYRKLFITRYRDLYSANADRSTSSGYDGPIGAYCGTSVPGFIRSDGTVQHRLVPGTTVRYLTR